MRSISFQQCRPLLAALLFACRIVMPCAADEVAPPTFTGEAFPEPPAQHQPWTAPAKPTISAAFIDATRQLFDLGFPDPRGCEYRKVRISTGSIWGGGGDTPEVCAWVLPARDDFNSRRFVIAWNGLIYPAISVGEQVDLRADIEASCTGYETARKEAGDDPVKQSDLSRGGSTELSSTSDKYLGPIRICLLLRLNEQKLAERVWADCPSAASPGGFSNDAHPDDPFLMLAGDWIWSHYDRAVTAHMRGEDHLALLDSRALLTLQRQVDDLGERRGFEKDEHDGKRAKSFFEYLYALPVLAADESQRLKAPATPLQVINRIRDPKERIKALVDHLSEVSPRQWSQPGGVDLGSDPAIKALVNEGDAAVEPLLNCLDNETRLTRTVHFWRDSSQWRSLVGEHEAAYVALSTLLDRSFYIAPTWTDDLSAMDPSERRELAKSVRAYWDKYKRFSREDRWFQALADDTADRDQWIQAAENIVRPANVEADRSSIPAGPLTMTRVTEPVEFTPAPQRGAVLRKHENPSVSDLLIKRIKSLSGGGDDEGNSNLQNAAALIDVLAAWDGEHSRQTLSAFSGTLRQRFRRTRESDAGRALIPQIVRLYLRRVEAGDQTALAEYAQWIVTVTPSDARDCTDTLFEPLWKYPESREIVDVADRLFNGAGSFWNPLLKVRKDAEGFVPLKILDTPAIGVKAIRAQLVRELDDHKEIGTVSVNSVADEGITLPWYSIGLSMADFADPRRPKEKAEIPFRVCDLVAWQLSRSGGFPYIELYWPLADKEAAIAKTRSVLLRYGDRLQWTPLQDFLRKYSSDVETIAFAPLDHPATPAEVASGKAIFSFEPQSRLWKMRAYPMRARMPTLQVVPGTTESWDIKTKKPTYAKVWQQEGFVWQAEEAIENGKWTRYFGFVGPGFIGKVSADQIEFPATLNEYWFPLGNGIEWRIERVEVSSDTRSHQQSSDDLRVRLLIRNSRGISQSVPADWYRPDTHLLRDGFELQLQRDSGNPAKEGWGDDWDKVPPTTPGGHFVPSAAGKILAPTEQFVAATIDLRQLFPISKDGLYQVILEQTKPTEGTAEPYRCSVSFSIDDSHRSHAP